ncbi:unnamed protein product [Amoebophrya sp. A120]|nr:unnamed protein product [Amoebophrya sp. A120]|eukprot:GSA120T00024429001.1
MTPVLQSRETTLFRFTTSVEDHHTRIQNDRTLAFAEVNRSLPPHFLHPEDLDLELRLLEVVLVTRVAGSAARTSL